MEKEFIPYEMALRMKAVGFNEPCFAFRKDPNMIFIAVYNQPTPTFSQAFRWFRNEHRMFHEVFIDTEPTVEQPDKLEFSYLILHMTGNEHMYLDKEKKKRFDTYEEAELACLDRIIEVIEEKQIKPYEDIVS